MQKLLEKIFLNKKQAVSLSLSLLYFLLSYYHSPFLSLAISPFPMLNFHYWVSQIIFSQKDLQSPMLGIDSNSHSTIWQMEIINLEHIEKLP